MILMFVGVLHVAAVTVCAANGEQHSDPQFDMANREELFKQV